MAHNRQPDFKPNNHPSSSDDDEEEEEEEEEEEASGSEDEQTSCSESEEQEPSDSEPKHEPKKPLIPPPQSAKKPQQPPDLSSSGTEDSDSDTDSDSPPKKSSIDPTIKPISSKPMEREEGTTYPAKRSGSGSKPSSTPSPAKAGKRPPPAASPAVEKDLKKAKKSTAADEDSKKQLFQRLWSEDDEIVILKGMIDYKTEKNGENPVADMGAFHEFIKKALHVDVSRAQLVDKVRRLKKKYVNNASREKNGKDRSFSKSHEQKGYELSKLIWGSNSHTESKKIQNQNHNNNPNPAKGNAAGTSSGAALLKANGVEMEKEVSTMEVDKSMDVSRFVQYGRNSDSPILQEEIVKAGLELVEASKREELEEKWKKLKKQELQLYVMRLELLKEQSALVYEAVNSSGN